MSRAGRRPLNARYLRFVLFALAGCGNDNGGPVPVVCIEPTWAAIHAEISAPRCANTACHAGEGAMASNTLDLEGDPDAVYARLVGVATADPEGAALFPLRVAAGSSTTSYFLHMLESQTPIGSELGGMPPGRPFPECDITAIRTWINLGAPQR